MLKRNTITVIILFLITVIMVVLWSYRVIKNTHSQQEEESIADFELIAAKSTPEYNYFESQRYLFSFLVDKQFRYYESVSLAKLTMVFLAPNTDMTEKPNRDTPNKINTSPENKFSLIVFENRGGITFSDRDQFLAWHQEMFQGVEIDQLDLIDVSGSPVLKTIQPDGIDSRGFYYYFVGVHYIYLFGTDDFDDATMRSIISRFEFKTFSG